MWKHTETDLNCAAGRSASVSGNFLIMGDTIRGSHTCRCFGLLRTNVVAENKRNSS